MVCSRNADKAFTIIVNCYLYIYFSLCFYNSDVSENYKNQEIILQKETIRFCKLSYLLLYSSPNIVRFICTVENHKIY